MSSEHLSKEVLPYQALAEKTEAEKRAAQAALTAQLGEAWEALAKALKQLEILDGKLLPAANNAIEAASTAYQAGRLSQLEILDARRTLTDARTQALQARIAAHKAAATIDALTAPARDFTDKTVQPPARKR